MSFKEQMELIRNRDKLYEQYNKSQRESYERWKKEQEKQLDK